MKELSIEEKAKAYDEAKARMSKAYNDNRCTIGFMNEIFPELKESEDERIRKAIILHYQGDGFICTNEYRIDYKDIRAWLEKQELPTDINPSEFDSRLNKLLEQFKSLPKEEILNSLNFYHNVVKNGEKYFKDDKLFNDQEQRDIWEYVEQFKTSYGHYPKNADEIAVIIKEILNSRQKWDIKWKPTDKQIKALELAVDRIYKQFGCSSDLLSLVGELKKL